MSAKKKKDRPSPQKKQQEKPPAPLSSAPQPIREKPQAPLSSAPQPIAKKPQASVSSPPQPTPEKPAGWWRGYGDRGLWSWRIAAVLLTAASQPVLSAPFNWWPLHWFAWLPFLWAIHAQGGRGRIFLGYLGGTASNFMIFYWVIGLQQEFGKIPLPVAFLLNWLLCSALSSIWIFLAWGTPWLSRRFPKLWIYLVPAFLASMEYILPQLFPYMQGVSHYQVMPVFQLASLFGTYSVTSVILWCNTLLYDGLKRWKDEKEQRYREIAFFLAVMASVLSYGVYREHLYDQKEKTARRLKIAMIQSNFLPKDHWGKGFNHVLSIYRDLSLQAVKAGADWIVWSEGEYKASVTGSFGLEMLGKLSKELGRPLLVGGHGSRLVNKQWEFTNSAIHMQPNGQSGTRYDKVILVPFGEYVPFEAQIGPIMAKITKWRSRFTAGKEQIVHTLQGVPYSFLICYEAIYPTYVRNSVRKGAHLLVNITYDAWFGKTTAPYQHLMLAATRSAELGVPLVRLATTGASTTVDAMGRMRSLSPLFERKVIVHELPLVFMPSLYLWIGDLFVWLCMLFCFAAFLYGRRAQIA
jgi:apolipoprotein N-acyltransferase